MQGQIALVCRGQIALVCRGQIALVWLWSDDTFVRVCVRPVLFRVLGT